MIILFKIVRNIKILII